MAISNGTIPGSYIGQNLLEDTDCDHTVETGKGSSGNMYQVLINNNANSSAVYLKLYDTTGTVTLGSSHPDFVFPCPATSTRQYNFHDGLPFATGLKFLCSTVGGTGDSGDNAPAESVIVRISIG